MTTVTGLTADRMLDIEAAAIVDGDVIDGNLILTRHDGTQINAGPVIGPEGPPGPVGSDLSVISAKPILDIGLANQIRAGRQLGPADFGNMGLSAPVGLWNLSDLSDSSGNGRNLLNKGAVTFAPGINGIASSAALFTGSTGQALYIADTGANDPFRIRTGSVGAWFRTAKRGLAQGLVTKRGSGAPGYGYQLSVGNGNQVVSHISSTGSDFISVVGLVDVCDDRWHFAVFTHDGHMHRLYVDGVLESQNGFNAPIFPVGQSLNIGGFNADGASPSIEPMYGRIDEAFITPDVLTEDQIRNLYCTKIPHTLGSIPSRVTINVRRRRKGPALVPADFPAQPLRLHNFSAGSLGDEGSANIPLTSNPGSGSIASVAGADGTLGNAFYFSGAHAGLSSTDAGLPAGLSARSLGAWFKTLNALAYNIVIAYGTFDTGTSKFYLNNVGSIASTSGGSQVITGPFAADGLWHFGVIVEENAPVDGLKRKLYLDGRLVGAVTGLNSVVLAGANRFRIGADPDGSSPLHGQIDGAFACNYALTIDQIIALYIKGSQVLASSPKNAGDHIEALTSTDLLAVFDNLDSAHQVDLGVAV